VRIKFLAVLALLVFCVAVSVLAKPPAPPSPYNLSFQLVNNLPHPVTFMVGMRVFLETASDFYKKDLADENFAFNVEVPANGRVTHNKVLDGRWNSYVVQHLFSVSVWGNGRELGNGQDRAANCKNFVITANPTAPVVSISRSN